MAVRITLNSPIPSAIPGDGWTVGYKILGDPGAYTVVGPFMSVPIHIDTLDAAGTLYEGYIQRDCGALTSTNFFWQTPCSCSDPGFTTSPSGNQCQKDETEAPDITNSGYCLATSQNTLYGSWETRIYLPGFDASDIYLPSGSSGGNIFGTMSLNPQWTNSTFNISLGPLNREGVWIDSNCDGTPNALTNGVQTTISYLYNNVTGSNKTIYLGIGADNFFKVVVNGSIIVDTGMTAGDEPFRIWHVMPVIVVPGPNYINLVGTGDGTTSDTVGMVVYDNTASQILAATSDLDLIIPFKSSDLRGTSFDVSTCDAGWSLDTSGGQGNYICRRTTYESCNTIPV